MQGSMFGAGSMLGNLGGTARDPRVEQLYQQFVQRAEAAYQMAKASGQQVPEIDYAAIRQEAERMASGAPPSPAVQEAMEFQRQMEGQAGGAGQAAAEGREPGPWGRLGTAYMGQEIPAEVARYNRNAGLADAGLALMASAGTPNQHQGLTDALVAFRGRMEGGSGAYLQQQQRAREAAIEERKARLAERRTEGLIDQTEARVGEIQDAARRRTEEEEAKHRTMAAIYDAISSELGEDSPESRLAGAYFEAGPAMWDRMAGLADGLIQERRLGREQEVLLDWRIKGAQRAYEEDPNKAFDRKIATERVAIARSSASRPRGGGYTPAQRLDDIASEATRRYKQKLDAVKVGGILPIGLDTQAIMDEARAEAADYVDSMMGSRGPLPRSTTVREVDRPRDRNAPPTEQEVESRVAELRKVMAAYPQATDEELIRELASDLGGDRRLAESIVKRARGGT